MYTPVSLSQIPNKFLAGCTTQPAGICNLVARLYINYVQMLHNTIPLTNLARLTQHQLNSCGMFCCEQKYRTSVLDIMWPARVEDTVFLVFPDGSVQLSGIDGDGNHTASVCLSPTRLMFTARFLAKIGQSSLGQQGFHTAAISVCNNSDGHLC